MFTNDVVHPMQSFAIKELLRKLPILPFFALNSMTIVPTAMMAEFGRLETTGADVKKQEYIPRFHSSLEKLGDNWNSNLELEPAVQSRARKMFTGNPLLVFIFTHSLLYPRAQALRQ